jgi:hypothetical protein
LRIRCLSLAKSCTSSANNQIMARDLLDWLRGRPHLSGARQNALQLTIQAVSGATKWPPKRVYSLGRRDRNPEPTLANGA